MKPFGGVCCNLAIAGAVEKADTVGFLSSERVHSNTLTVIMPISLIDTLWLLKLNFI